MKKSRYAPFSLVRNYAKHRCQSVTIAFDRNKVKSEHEAFCRVERAMQDSTGTWTFEWSNRDNKITVYSTDTIALTFIGIGGEEEV